MRYVFLLSLLTLGCASKKQIQATPGVHKYDHCKEISIDAKDRTVTVVCPLDK